MVAKMDGTKFWFNLSGDIPVLDDKNKAEIVTIDDDETNKHLQKKYESLMMDLAVAISETVKSGDGSLSTGRRPKCACGNYSDSYYTRTTGGEYICLDCLMKADSMVSTEIILDMRGRFGKQKSGKPKSKRTK